MDSQNILSKMSSMRLEGMHNLYKNMLGSSQCDSVTNEELLTLLINAEWDNRENNRIERALKEAKFRYQASIENIRYDDDRGLDKSQIIRLSECSYIKQAKNILITGFTGTGKSYLASAFGHQACYHGYKVLYYNAQKLFAKLKNAKADNTYYKLMAKIAKQDLLIIDDFGLHVLDDLDRLILLEIMEDRYGLKSTIISSQLPVKVWYDIIGESTIADAVMDRLVNGAFRIEIKSKKSLRE
ncbi:MAG TPA: IS21-like element helper ATPase IstB [Spirochaetales bacterium]|nr:IS21-like element helper ATPase IstB [Spirochaetales bacterium]